MIKFLPATSETSTKGLIIEYLADKWPLTARQISNHLRKQSTKPITYQAVHKTLKELVSNGCLIKANNSYALSTKWIEISFGFFSGVRKKYSAQKSIASGEYAHCMFRVYDFPDAFYQLIVPLFKKEEVIRLCSKTPALIISSEADLSLARKKYFETMVYASKQGTPRIKYLISYDLTKKKILEEKDFDGLSRLKEYSKASNIEIRCAPTKSIVSGAVCKKDYFVCLTSVPHTDSIGVIHIVGEDFSNIIELYDNNFVNAFDVHDLIEDIEKHFKLTKKLS